MIPLQLFGTPPVPYNLLLLHEEASQLDGFQGLGLVNEGEVGEQILFTFEAGSAASQNVVDTLLAAHDGEALSQTELSGVVKQSGEQGFTNLPGWATWTAAEAEAYIDANVTDLASAIVVLKAMAKAIVALRNARWPGLQGG